MLTEFSAMRGSPFGLIIISKYWIELFENASKPDHLEPYRAGAKKNESEKV